VGEPLRRAKLRNQDSRLREKVLVGTAQRAPLHHPTDPFCGIHGLGRSIHITARSSPDSVGWAKALLRRAYRLDDAKQALGTNLGAEAMKFLDEPHRVNPVAGHE
jgi:hypothetical protein